MLNVNIFIQKLLKRCNVYIGNRIKTKVYYRKWERAKANSLHFVYASMRHSGFEIALNDCLYLSNPVLHISRDFFP